ncbi:Rab GDP dissociation inhibitor alpha [Pelomyxa schiedti]|nr:Rab GDP dissociation inhibitor alpha [Pelomyxa schiedti]
MEDTYDAIVMGTGLKECILSGLLSVDGLKVLHLDRNGYYGGACASLNINQLFEQFKGGAKPPATLGQNREYNVDIVPKFIMADGLLVQMLLHTDVTRYLEFKSIAGSYVYRSGRIHKVPATDMEALKSPLMGPFEKRRCKKFFQYISDYEENDPKTHDGADLTRMPMSALFAKFSLEPDTIDFVGHAIALYRDDSYLTQPAVETVRKVKLYFSSLARYSKSPYLYPLYGLGELPQGFARLSAIYGGTYMLNGPIGPAIYEAGKIVGIQSTEPPNPIARCKFVVADPSYFPDKVKKVGQVIRAICILSHPVRDTEDAESTQIIIPQKQVGRQSDIYICVMSSANFVCPKGRWIAIVATSVETPNPEAELTPGLNLLNPIDEQFISVTDSYVPLADGTADRVFISKSYDATTHFESTVEDVMSMYRRITGKDLVLKPKEHPEEGATSTTTSTTASGGH